MAGNKAPVMNQPELYTKTRDQCQARENSRTALDWLKFLFSDWLEYVVRVFFFKKLPSDIHSVMSCKVIVNVLLPFDPCRSRIPWSCHGAPVQVPMVWVVLEQRLEEQAPVNHREIINI